MNPKWVWNENNWNMKNKASVWHHFFFIDIDFNPSITTPNREQKSFNHHLMETHETANKEQFSKHEFAIVKRKKKKPKLPGWLDSWGLEEPKQQVSRTSIQLKAASRAWNCTNKPRNQRTADPRTWTQKVMKFKRNNGNVTCSGSSQRSSRVFLRRWSVWEIFKIVFFLSG